MQRVIKVHFRTENVTDAANSGQKSILLKHDERRVRRKTLTLDNNDKVLVDLPEVVSLHSGVKLVLEDGSEVTVVAATEPLYAVTARNAVHLSELAWHIGNRHLAAEISADRILILRDHVIKSMLIGLGATVEDIEAPFEPVRGAYHHLDHGHSHHDHDHGHSHHDHH